MQLLLGLFFFSSLLTTGSSIQCVNCVALNGYCSDVKQECPNGTEACLSMLLKVEVETSIQIVMKHCTRKTECKKFENLIEKPVPFKIPIIPDGTVLKEFTCSKAPLSFASSFPAFLGLLLMKLLF